MLTLNIMETPVPRAPTALVAAIFGTLLIIGIIGAIGRRIRRDNKWDEKTQAALVVVGVAGVLSLFPLFRVLGAFFENILTEVVAKMGGGDYTDWLVLVWVAVGVVGIAMYIDKPSIGKAVWMTVLLSPLLSTDLAQKIVAFYVDNIAVNAYNFFAWLFELLQTMPLGGS